MASAHARAFGSLGDVRLAGICSRTRERAEVLARETGIENVYDDVDSLWSGARADAVVIAVKEPAAQAVI